MVADRHTPLASTARQGRRTQQRITAARARRQRRIVALAGGGVVLVLAGMLAVKLLLSSQPPAAASEAPVPADVLQAVTQVPPDLLDAIGTGTVRSLPARASAPIARAADGLPLVTYIGAEYCPYCAGERWAMVVALSRFGTFSNLRTTTSAADDIYPSTPTFTFYGATYTSQYLDFSTVELESNVRSGGQYRPLQTPTAGQQQLLQTYDAPPYVPSGSDGSIPFVDFANQYVVSGASFDVGVLQGRSWQAISASLSDPSSDQARAILGTANVLTAAICKTTSNSPADVCGGPTIASLETTLSSQQPPA
jgi:hypothetical protein